MLKLFLWVEPPESSFWFSYSVDDFNSYLTMKMEALREDFQIFTSSHI